MKRLLFLLVVLSRIALAQPTPGQVVVGNFSTQYVLIAPSGACSQNAALQVVVGVGTIYTCQNGTWAQASGSGGGITGLTSGVIPQAGSATTVVNSSPQLDNGLTTPNTLTYGGSGGFSAPSYTATGTVVGGVFLGQGTAAGLGTTAVGLVAPTSVTSYDDVFPTAASTGYLKLSTTTNQTGCTASATNMCGVYVSTIPNTDLPSGIPSGTDSSVTANVYTVTLSPAPTAMVAGQTIGCFMPHVANTSINPTGQFNGLGSPLTIVKAGGTGGGIALFASNDIITTEPACLLFDGSNLLLLNPQAATGTGRTVLSSAPAFGGTVTSNATSTIWDFSASTGTAAFITPKCGGCTATAAAVIDFDTTNKNYHGYVNGADSIFLNSAANLTTNVLPKAVIASSNMLMANSSITDNGTTVVTAEPVKAGTVTSDPSFVDVSTGFLASSMSTQSSATLTAITNMTWHLAASKNFKLLCDIPVTLASTGTLAYGLVGPGTPTSYNLDFYGMVGAAGVAGDFNILAQSTWVSTKTGATSALAATVMTHVNASIQNGSTAGTLTLDTSNVAGTGTIQVLANAVCTLTQVN